MKHQMVKMGNDYCPYCNEKLTAASDIKGDAIPQPRDLSVCFYCGNFMYYADDMKLEKYPDLLFEELPVETKNTLLKAQYLIRHRKHEKNNI